MKNPNKSVPFDSIMEELKQSHSQDFEEIKNSVNQLNEKIQREESKYVKDKDGYAVLLPVSEINDTHIIITEEEFNKIVGQKETINAHKRGGYRPGSGRKKACTKRVKITKEIPEETRELLRLFSKHNKIPENEIINRLIIKGCLENPGLIFGQ